MGLAPFEIIVAPFQVYVGPVGEAFPDVDETPAGNWLLVGLNGNENMDPSGVTVSHPQTVDLHRPYGTGAPVKATRSQEDVMISFVLWDLLAVQYSRILNDNTVTATAAGSGTPGYDTVNLLRGIEVSAKAWLIKGLDASPEGDGWAMQYEIPKGVVTSSSAVVFSKTSPAGLQFEITTLFDTSETAGEELGRLVIQDATAV